MREVKLSTWNLISGISKSVKRARLIMENADIKEKPQNLVRKTKIANIYATLVHGNIYGKTRNVAVYVNPLKALNEREDHNSELSRIGKELDDLSGRCTGWDESGIHAELSRIVGEWNKYMDVRIKRNPDMKNRIEWKYHSHAITASERLDGRSAILCTDPSVSAEEIVNMYLERDFVEKVFRTMKTQEEVVPVRHRLERRIRAYVFVMVTAYRLIAYLVLMMRESGEKEPWESVSSMLDRLSRVERIGITFGKETRTWYLNLRPNTSELLKRIGFGKLFNEEAGKNRHWIL